MSEELKPCPFCGRTPNPDWTDESYIECTNRKCSLYGYGMSTGDWNTRPIENALNKRIAELEGLVQRLVEAGDRLSDSLCTYPEEEKTIEVCNWNAIVAEYEECEK